MVNKATIIGRTGGAPERRGNEDGPVTVGLATSYKYKDRNGERVEAPTQWHNLVFWGKVGDIALKYVGKGDLLYIEGRIEYNKYTDKEGIEKTSTNIVVEKMQMLGSKNGKKNSNSEESQKYANEDTISVEDIPF